MSHQDLGLWLKTGAALAALVAASPALAQPVPEPQEEEAGTTATTDIVVTARRTEESLQRVPAAVSAFNERALERIQAQDTTGLQGAVPNLNIVQGRGSSNATNIFIRGVGQPDALQTFDPAVGFYVDGVYYSRIRGTQLDLLDLERIEVLRGPQGTLYGKNTIGGAVSIVTQRPGNELRGSLALTYGTYDQLELRGSVSGPLSDTVAAGVAILHAQRDGFVEDRVLDRDYNDRDTQAIRGRIAFTPNDRLRIDLIADYSQDDAGLSTGQPLNNLTYLVGGGTALVVPQNAPYDFTVRTTPSLPNSTELTHWGLSLQAAYDVSDAVTIRSITAYRELSTDDYIDIDATQLEVGDVFVGVDQNQFSQELQLNVNAGPLTGVAGLYYLQENVGSHQEAYADDLIGPLLGNPTFTRTIDDDLETTSLAAYANLSYEIAPRLRLSAGIRFTHETKDYFRTTSTFSSLALLRSATPFNFVREDDWSDVSPMASIDYQITPDVMVYGRYARGFKSGGFNGRANSAAEASSYEPETADSFEIGLRTNIARQLRFNLTAFANDYTNFQARVSGTDVDPITGIPAPVLGVLNAGGLNIRGLELEAAWTPIRGLLLDAQIGYLDAEYSEFADARFTSTGGSRAFQTPAFAPDWTIRLGAQYEADLGGSGFLTIGGQSRFRSETALAIDNTLVNSQTRIAGLFQDDFWVHDARIVWENASRRYSLGLYVQNLGDEVYKTDGQEFSSVGNIRTVYYGAPRTAYVRGIIRF